MAIQHDVVFGTITDVTDPNIINHTFAYNALPMRLDTKALKLISSFRYNVASVEEPSFPQSLWDISLPALRLVDAVLSQCWARSMLFAMTWCILAMGTSSATAEVKQRKRQQGLCMRCAFKSALLFHNKAPAMKFSSLDDKGKGKKKKEVQDTKQREMHFIPQYSSRLGSWSSPFSVLLLPLTAVLSVLKVRFDYLRHNSSQWGELPREAGTG